MALNLGVSIYFFIKAVLFGIATIVAIPKRVYKKYLLWGFLFGGIGELIMVTLFSRVLNLINYYNMGVFNIFNIMSFWTPIAWMFSFMLFFYFLPTHRYILLIYIIGFSIYGFMVGLVLQNIGLFKYEGLYIYFAPFVFFAWFSASAYVFFRYNRLVN